MTWDDLRRNLGSQHRTVETLANGSLRSNLNFQPIDRIEALPEVRVIHAAHCTAACFRCPVSEGEVEILGELEGSKHGIMLIKGTATLTLARAEPTRKSN